MCVFYLSLMQPGLLGYSLAAARQFQAAGEEESLILNGVARLARFLPRRACVCVSLTVFTIASSRRTLRFFVQGNPTLLSRAN